MLAVFVTINYYDDIRLYKLYGQLKKIADKVIFIRPNIVVRKRILRTLSWRIGLPYDEHKINTKLLAVCKENPVDFVLVMKGNYLYPSTIQKINKMGIKTVSYSLDDLFLRRNRSLFFKYGIKYYDLVVTTKRFNLNKNEFPKWGAKNILFQYQAFDEETHIPHSKITNCKHAHDVVFVGSFEKERHEYLEYLADNKVEVHIYSPGWKNKIINKEYLIVHDHHLYLDDFACALGCSKIALNFLRKINRDVHTSRSFEIPACGGFMLAERTIEHLELFEEGKEAEYFNTKEELFNKVVYYLHDEDSRKIIADAGYLKCLSEGYSYTNRIKEIINNLYNAEK